MNFGNIDYIIFGLYAALILSIGLWVSRSKKGKSKTAEDYFLASKSLPWWAIGTSLIAANISAEQIIGMSGQGFGIGLAIASYEWMSAITLIISVELKTILAVFWIALFTFVNLTTVLLLGAKALDMIVGTGNGDFLWYGIIGLALFAAAYSLWGGLSAVAWTDVIQVVLLVIGGLITTLIALDKVTPEGGIWHGTQHILQVAPEKFHLILSKSHPLYKELPGLAVLVGGMWVANLYYWGFNQYIIQRALAAKNLQEAQKGLAFAGFLKLIVPFIVVIPGIIAFVLYAQPQGTNIISGVSDHLAVSEAFQANDNAYPWLIKSFVPVGLKGLVLAALAAAIVSSLASMINSISTIFTMDIYKQYFNKNASDKQTVRTGRIVAFVALLIGVLVTPLLSSERGIFNVIQEYTGMVSPGILAIFMLGLFWKKATNKAAIWGAILSIVVAFLFKLTDLPWMDAKGITLTKTMFSTSKAFNASAFVILLVLAFLYSAFW